MAVKLEPQNLQYQQLLSQLRGGGQWYSDMGSGYGYERSAGDLGNGAVNVWQSMPSAIAAAVAEEDFSAVDQKIITRNV